MIPLATEIRAEIALRRDFELAADGAPNRQAAEAQSIILLEQIQYALEIARKERRSGRTGVQIPLNALERHSPSLELIRLFLVAKGYSVSVGADFVTVSWN